MFAMVNLGPILITMAVVAGLAALAAIGLVVAVVVAVRRAVRRRAAVRAVGGAHQAMQRPVENTRPV